MSGGYIPCYHESEVLQAKVRRHGWVLARAIAQGTVSFLMLYHLKISNVFVVFLLGQHSAQLCWLRETCWVAKRSCYSICQQQGVSTTVGVQQSLHELGFIFKSHTKYINPTPTPICKTLFCQGQKSFLQAKFCSKIYSSLMK